MKSKSMLTLLGILTLVGIMTIAPSAFAATASSTPQPPSKIGSSASPSKIGSSASPSKIGSSASPSKIGSLAPPSKIGSLAPPSKIGSANAQSNNASNSLVKNQSVKYALVFDIESDSEELKAALESSLSSSLLESFVGATDITIKKPDDIEWVKATITDNSPQNVTIETELKLRGQQDPIVGKSESVSGIFSNSVLFISTTGIDEGHVIQLNQGKGSENFPSQLVLNKSVVLNIGGASINAYEFSGNTKIADDSGSFDTTITTHYEKDTGMLVGLLMTLNVEVPQGSVVINFGLKATEIIIPTTLSISLPGKINEDNDLVVTGKITPAVSEGQVVLTYQKNDSSQQPTKRTVSVTDGTFSDSYKLGSGIYTVSAEYLGSGAYLSSTTDKNILDVTSSEGQIMNFAIIGIVVFIGIIAAITLGIYFAVKRIKNRKKTTQRQT